MKANTARVLCAAMALVLLASCGAAKSAEKKAQEEKRAVARAKIAEMESALPAAATDKAARVKGLRDILGIQVMSLGDLQPALDRYAKEQDILSADPQSRVYAAVAESMQAGREKKIENKLKWLRRGMSSFESLREDFPDNEDVFLYQASTYANFPPEVGAKAEVLDILGAMLSRYKANAWEMSPGTAGQVEYVYAGLRGNYTDSGSKAEILASETEFANAIPAFAQVVAAGRESAAKRGSAK